jgi:nucleotide-binding universal stress UspA family protein
VIRLKRILYPTDFSEYSQSALPYAVSFARQYAAKLYVIHVVEPMVLPADFSWTSTVDQAMDRKREDASRESLERFVRENALEDIEVEVVIRHGNAFLELVRMARDLEIDLVVMATHGRAGLAHALLGSTAEKVVRKAPCPVLTVKHPEHEFVMP